MKKFKRITIISNLSLEIYLEKEIRNVFFEYKTDSIVQVISLDECFLEDNKHWYEKSDLIIIWINLESLYPDMLNKIYSKKYTEKQTIVDIFAICKRYINHILCNSQCLCLFFLFEDYYLNNYLYKGNTYEFSMVDTLNCKLSELNNEVVYINLKRIIATLGVGKSYNNKYKYHWKCPYTKELHKMVANEIFKQYLINSGISKKCIVLDCDNVLWRGIVSEDGIENLKLGNDGIGGIYKNFQRFLLSLYYNGIILAICSKNDMCDIERVFSSHCEMVLKTEHIACFEVNWNSKVENLKKISTFLNINLDSMVFIDDSPVEVSVVNKELPEITSILFEPYWSYTKWEFLFNLRKKIDIQDIDKRNRTYIANRVREKLREDCNNDQEYLKELKMRIDIHKASCYELERISELSQRTNKFTNGVRYTVSELKRHLEKSEVSLYSVTVEDKFSDLGIVGAIEITNTMLTLFCLSCRAFGRKVEEDMIKFIKESHVVESVKLYDTRKNDDFDGFLNQYFPDMANIDVHCE